MEAVKDRLRVALALLVAEQAFTEEDIPLIVTELQMYNSSRLRAFATQALCQALSQANNTPAHSNPLHRAEQTVSMLSKQLSDAQKAHALQLHQRDLELERLRTQLATCTDIGPGASTFLFGDMQASEDATTLPFGIQARPKSKKAKARDFAVQSLDLTLHQYADTAPFLTDLKHGYAIVDSLQSLRISAKSFKSQTRTETLALFLEKISLLERGSVRIITAITRVLSLGGYTLAERATKSGPSTLSAKMSDILPVLTDVLRWLLKTVSDLLQHASKVTSRHFETRASQVQAASDTLLEAVSAEVGTLVRFCIKSILSTSYRLNPNTTGRSVVGGTTKVKFTMQAMHPDAAQMNRTVRSRLVDMLEALVLHTLNGELQTHIDSQVLISLLDAVQDTLSVCFSSRREEQIQPHAPSNPRKDILVILLPLLVKVAAQTKPSILLDAAVERAYQTLHHFCTDVHLMKGFEEMFGDTLRAHLFAALEELLLKHSVLDFTRLINLAPV